MIPDSNRSKIRGSETEKSQDLKNSEFEELREFGALALPRLSG